MAEKEAVRTEEAPAPFQGAPYSQAIRAGGLVFVSGQVALVPGASEPVGSDVGEQTEQVLANLRAILEAAGSGLDRVVKTTVYLTNLDDFQAMNDVYRSARRGSAARPRDRRGVGASLGRAGRDRRDCARLTRSRDGLGSLDLPRGQGVYLVGGAVRDLLLGRESFDVDLAVEGDAIEFARGLGGEVTAHGRFGTAVVRFPDGRQLDVVTCRRETYAAPAALPDVEAGTIEDDLARRDFTVNAMAASLGERLRAAGRPARRPRRPGERDDPDPARAIVHRRSDKDLPGGPVREAARASGWTRRRRGSRGKELPASACSRARGSARRSLRCSPRTEREQSLDRLAQFAAAPPARAGARRTAGRPAGGARPRCAALARAADSARSRPSGADRAALAPAAGCTGGRGGGRAGARAGGGDRPGRDRGSRRPRARGRAARAGAAGFGSTTRLVHAAPQRAARGDRSRPGRAGRARVAARGGDPRGAPPPQAARGAGRPPRPSWPPRES